jgi:hypothetical protein
MRFFAGRSKRVVGRTRTAGSNAGEFWAEVAQSYFDCNRVNNWNHGPIGTREQLKVYDPETYELVRATFNLSPAQDWRYSFLQKAPTIIPPPARFKIDPYYTKFTWAREFPVVGRGASDAALLKANDTVRKMFAYRHDILKALIADGVKLVILGRDEKLADLPEIKKLEPLPSSVDRLARILDYRPETKLLVVGEENVLANPKEPNMGDHQVIRLFAKALYHATASRPVDPNWENRGRNVQQYELRVQRLDERFDKRLRELYEKSIAAEKWKGTAAVHDHVQFWASGVLAYFDASGQDAAPNDAPHPIQSREAVAGLRSRPLRPRSRNHGLRRPCRLALQAVNTKPILFGGAICASLLILLLPLAAATAQSPADITSLERNGKRDVRVHDPSTIVKCKNEYWFFATGTWREFVALEGSHSLGTRPARVHQSAAMDHQHCRWPSRLFLGARRHPACRPVLGLLLGSRSSAKILLPSASHRIRRLIPLTPPGAGRITALPSSPGGPIISMRLIPR